MPVRTIVNVAGRSAWIPAFAGITLGVLSASYAATAHSQPPPQKTLFLTVNAAESTFDPAAIDDILSLIHI